MSEPGVTDAPETPATPTELSELLVGVHAARTSVRVVGSGTWLDAGRPVTATRRITTRGLSGIVEYVPGDLVITVRGGTTLGEIADVTAAHDQWLALDPYVHAGALRTATIGATIATASSGPLSLGFGRARDLALGLSFVCGDGTPVRAGGRVVKNVAGFDLVRLTTGAWGTLGVITEISLRLHARPAIDESFAIHLDWPATTDARAAALTALAQRLNTPPLLAVTSALVSLVVLTDHATGVLGGAAQADRCVLLARATGNRTRVHAIRQALAVLGDLVPVDVAVWDAVRTLESGNTTIRSSDAPSRMGDTWQHVSTWMAQHRAREVHTIIEPLRGALRMSGKCADNNGDVDSAADADGGTGDVRGWRLPARALAERLPVEAWGAQPSSIDDVISQRLRTTLDPAGVLNPGILGAHGAPVGAA